MATTTHNIPNICGEVITWSCGRAGHGRFTTTLTAIRTALDQAGFDKKLARDLAGRNALCRVLHDLGQTGMVRKVSEDDKEFVFQVNEVARTSNGNLSQLNFPFKAILVLDKKTNTILNPLGTQDGETLRVATENFLKQRAEERTAADVTRMIQRLASARTRGRRHNPSHPHVDLISIRNSGGVYFVFADQLPYVDKIQAFCDLIGADLSRLPVASAPGAQKSIAIALEDHLASLMKEVDEAIEKFGDTTRVRTLDSEAQRISDLRFMMESRSQFLSGQTAVLDQKLKDLDGKLDAMRQKLFGAGVPADEDAEEGDDQVDSQPATPVAPPMPAFVPFVSEEDECEDVVEEEPAAPVLHEPVAVAPVPTWDSDDDYYN